jgi:hypothetical protein
MDVIRHHDERIHEHAGVVSREGVPALQGHPSPSASSTRPASPAEAPSPASGAGGDEVRARRGVIVVAVAQRVRTGHPSIVAGDA